MFDLSFLKKVEKVVPDYKSIFGELYQGVIDTNKLIGLDYGPAMNEEANKLIDTYCLLVEEEIKEVEEAIQKKDKVNLLNELIDVLVVGGYQHYLETAEVFYYPVNDSSLSESLGFCFRGKDLTNRLIGVQDALAALECDLSKATKAILQANLSKFPTEDQLLYASGSYYDEVKPTLSALLKEEIRRLEEGSRYTGVTAEAVVDSNGETRYVFWSKYEMGVLKRKYLKPKSFLKANLEGCFHSYCFYK